MCTGHFVAYLYDSGVNLVESVDVVPGGVVLNVAAGNGMIWSDLICALWRVERFCFRQRIGI